MIRHALDPATLRAAISKEDAGWFTKARTRRAKLVQLGRFEERTSIWSSAKPAFMLLQSNKCIFCERLFAGPAESRIEMDLEHFRPKGRIEDWKPPAGPHPYPDSFGDASPAGYYWLAYDTGNYAAACKICNSDYKGACFPIAGPRCTTPDDTAALTAERACLVYPVGDADEDPEALITFTGTVAHPVAAAGERHARAALIIDFFGLNTRDQLHVQRAEIIERYGAALIAIADGRATRADHSYLAQIGLAAIPHSACLKAFKRLWDRDQDSARRLFHACRDMLAARLVDPSARGLGLGFG